MVINNYYRMSFIYFFSLYKIEKKRNFFQNVYNKRKKKKRHLKRRYANGFDPLA